MKQLITVADVKAAVESNSKSITVDTHTIITPAAKDYAKDKGILFLEDCCCHTNCEETVVGNTGEINVDKVLNALKSIVMGQGGLTNEFSRKKDSKSGFQIVRGQADIGFEVFDTGVPGNKVWYKEVLSPSESPHMAAGLLKMMDSSFPWHLSYDEVDYVLEGSVTITINGEEYTAYAGDVIYIPKDADVVWTAKEYVKLLYITYPANWADFL